MLRFLHRQAHCCFSSSSIMRQFFTPSISLSKQFPSFSPFPQFSSLTMPLDNVFLCADTSGLYARFDGADEMIKERVSWLDLTHNADYSNDAVILFHGMLFSSDSGLSSSSASSTFSHTSVTDDCSLSSLPFLLYDFSTLETIFRDEFGLSLTAEDESVPRFYVCLGRLCDGRRLWCVDVDELVDVEKFKNFCDSRFYHLLDLPLWFPSSAATLLAHGRGLLSWQKESRFCSRCGSKLIFRRQGNSQKCMQSTCGRENYPRLDPAVIVLVRAGEYLLLCRRMQYPAGRFTLVSGFVDVAETLEKTVLREVKEEADVDLDPASVEYVASQPWPFPRSFMTAFSATPKTRIIDACHNNNNKVEANGEGNNGEIVILEDNDFSSFVDLSAAKQILKNKGEKGKLPKVFFTRGGGFVPIENGEKFIYLPRTKPADGELEETMWVHEKLVQAVAHPEYNQTIEKIFSVNNENDESFEILKKKQLSLPPRTGISNTLLTNTQIHSSKNKL